VEQQMITGKTVEPTLLEVKHCDGCIDDFYNGHNDIGVSFCWNRTTAKLEPRFLIHIDAMPPYRNIKPSLRPTCYRQSRHVTVKPEAIGPDGYWK
jgi:hypothetical protein